MVPNFKEKLEEYAHLLVEVGLNIQPGQMVNLAAPVECAPLARLCAQVALDRGAKDVIMDWRDDFIVRERYLKADSQVFEEFPHYLKEKYEWLVQEGCTALSIIGSDPEMLRGVDSTRIQTWQRVQGENTRMWHDSLSANRFQWSIGAHPTKAWAEKVFPDKKGEEAIDALWEAIFSVCRITGDGKAVERWRDHVDATARRAKLLNEYNFKTLHYTNSLGTDLTITLPDNHVWMGGSEDTPKGVEFVANMPTEEIFTAPRWDGVNGRVYAAMPLALNGNLVKNFYMDFENGKIVNVHAEEGEEYLRHSVGMDEGSAYLGEVALVPYDSPIRNSGILFYNTLFDENASCHLAFGSAYPNCVKGGEDLDEAGQKAVGLNQSMNHVDFMVGTRDLSIVGTTQDGKEIPVFVDGNFAF